MHILIFDNIELTLDEIEEILISDQENYPNETGYWGKVTQSLINKLREFEDKSD